MRMLLAVLDIPCLAGRVAAVPAGPGPDRSAYRYRECRNRTDRPAGAAGHSGHSDRTGWQTGCRCSAALRGRIERIAVALRLRVIGVVGVAVVLLALWGLLCRLTERELLRGLGMLPPGRPAGPLPESESDHKRHIPGPDDTAVVSAAAAAAERCRRSRRGGDGRALALGGGVVRDGLGSGLRRLLIGSEGGRGNRACCSLESLALPASTESPPTNGFFGCGVAGIGSCYWGFRYSAGSGTPCGLNSSAIAAPFPKFLSRLFGGYSGTCPLPLLVCYLSSKGSQSGGFLNVD